jgi:hypothetical protein
LLEKFIIRLRRGRATSRALSYIKTKLGRGEFKQMDFVMRRHSARAFVTRLEKNGFDVIAQKSFGLNFMPYPFNVFCPAKLNRLANAWLDTAKSQTLQSLGEGYLVLCRKKHAGAAAAATPAA